MTEKPINDPAFFSGALNNLFGTPEEREARRAIEARARKDERSRALATWKATTELDTVLEHPDPLVVVLRVQIYVESAVAHVVRSKLKRPEAIWGTPNKAKYPSADGVLQLAEALGINPKMCAFVRTLSKLRNRLAHEDIQELTPTDMRKVISAGANWKTAVNSLIRLYDGNQLAHRFRATLHLATILADLMLGKHLNPKPDPAPSAGLSLRQPAPAASARPK